MRLDHEHYDYSRPFHQLLHATAAAFALVGQLPADTPYLTWATDIGVRHSLLAIENGLVHIALKPDRDVAQIESAADEVDVNVRVNAGELIPWGTVTLKLIGIRCAKEHMPEYSRWWPTYQIVAGSETIDLPEVDPTDIFIEAIRKHIW